MQMEHITSSKHLDLGKWLCEHNMNAKEHLANAQKNLKQHSVNDLLAQFKAQSVYYLKPPVQQTKTPAHHKVDTLLALKATLETQQTALQDLKDDKPMGSDPAAELLIADWQEWVDVLESGIRWLKQEVEKGTVELHAKDTTYNELKKAELDAWANGFLNLCVLRNHLLQKLWA